MLKDQKIIDYNGAGKWSQNQITKRYAQYCQELTILHPFDINPYEQITAEKRWIFPVMDKVILGIEQNDEACKIIGVELIEESQTMPFGRILKSNTARALRRSILNKHLEERLAARIVAMLIEGNVPHEYKEYAKLLRKIGISKSYWQEIERNFPYYNQYVLRYYTYFQLYCLPINTE
jgi:hypothetical protein